MHKQSLGADAALSSYLEADYFADWKNPNVIEYAQAAVKGASTPKQIAINLYHHIRDDFLYNPFALYFAEDKFRASDFLTRDSGHCIDKANLLVACARHQGIPARYRFANVRNHIGTEKLEAILKTDVLVFHGIAELFIDGNWIKLTPAFNKELCIKLNVEPLDFNGVDSTIFQQYNKSGDFFMEYLHDHGTFATLPFQTLVDTFFEHYPHLQDDQRFSHQ